MSIGVNFIIAFQENTNAVFVREIFGRIELIYVYYHIRQRTSEKATNYTIFCFGQCIELEAK